MNVFQRCPNTSELEPLYLPQQLFLRRIAKLSISLQLPNLKKLGKSVSHWEIMDKLKELVQPDEFTLLKVSKTTVEFVRLEAEVEKRSKLERVINKLNNKMIKLKDFNELMRVKAAEWHSEFPNRRVWDAYFSEAKDMNEMKPGERPDTIHISNVPSSWFALHHSHNEDELIPSEKIFYKVFEKFGNIRYVDIPICDPYRKKMKDHISGLKFSCFEKMDWFEGYIQFKDYIGFTKAMDFFRDKKLVHKSEDGYMEVEIRVDFDKTKHLSDASIRRREIVRDRLVKKAKEKEEKDKEALEEKRKLEEAEKKKEENIKTQKEIRRHMREEKRKAKIMKKLEITGSDDINAKIASEKKKLIKVQRKLEAIRLVEELFKRVKEKNSDNVQRYDVPDKHGEELRRLKNIRELNYLDQKEKLHNAVKGRAVLKSLIAKEIKPARFSDSSSSSELSLDEDPDKTNSNARIHGQHPSDRMFDIPPMYGFPYQAIYPPFGPQIYPDIDIYAVYKGRGRGRGRGRGYNARGRGGPNMRGSYHIPGAFDEHSKYYHPKSRHFHDDRRRSRSYSPQRNRPRSRSRSRGRSYSRRRSRSRSRSRSRKRSSRRRDYSSRSRSKSKSYDRRSRSRSRRRSHSSSRRTRSKSKNNDREHDHTNRVNRQSKSRSREKSVDSSKFMTPHQLQQLNKEQQKRRSRSKSWSMPKEQEPEGRSWSKTPEKVAENK